MIVSEAGYIKFKIMHKKFIILFWLLGFAFPSLYGQIVADHTVVSKFSDIPQSYIDLVKKMWVSYAGASHSAGVRAGANLLEASYPAYQVNVTESGTPEAYTDQHLRLSCATWGNYNNSSGWIYSYGQEDWFTTSQAITRTKAGITYCNTSGPALAAIGFGWCWDPEMIGSYITTYLDATQQYVDYCTTNNYSTKVFFTTGPVDLMNATGELGYNKYLAYQAIRTYVAADPARIFFDYADILCYDDNGSLTTTTWNGHTYPIITPNNVGDGNGTGHIAPAGQLRLAKAMWWMLARMAGWEGSPVVPTITTTAITNIATMTATGGGNVISDGGASVIAKGVCWNTNTNPTITNSHTSNGTGIGIFISSLTNLGKNIHYHVRAYATNSVGTSYGIDKEFTTACGQKADDTFTKPMYFNQGLTTTKIIFPDGTSMITIPTGTGSVTWDAILSKPLTFPPSVHNHDLLYKAITYVPAWAEITGKPDFFSGNYKDLTNKPDSIELGKALQQMRGIIPPRYTTAQIEALVPTAEEEGLEVYDITLHVKKYWNGNLWKIVITSN